MFRLCQNLDTYKGDESDDYDDDDDIDDDVVAEQAVDGRHLSYLHGGKVRRKSRQGRHSAQSEERTAVESSLLIEPLDEWHHSDRHDYHD